jgi:hypothetical protein
MNLETLPWKDFITMGAAALGAGLGIMNTWNSLNQRRVRLRVTPMHTFSVPGGQQGFGIEVINLSAFPVTVIDVGFSIGRRLGKAGRLSVIQPILIDGKPWPRRLESRESVSTYPDPRELVGHGKKIGKAYARTSCDTVVLRDSGALKQLRRMVNQ